MTLAMQHLQAAAITFGFVLVAAVCFRLGQVQDTWMRRARPLAEAWRGAPVVQLEWVNEVPVLVVKEGHAGDVAAWMEAAKDGTVLHV